jgi:hypothetical protein
MNNPDSRLEIGIVAVKPVNPFKGVESRPLNEALRFQETFLGNLRNLAAIQPTSIDEDIIKYNAEVLLEVLHLGGNK